MHKLEILASSLPYDTNSIKAILEYAIRLPARRVSLSGAHMEDSLEVTAHPSLHLSIDFPYGKNHTGAKMAMIDFYEETFGAYIHGYDVGIISNHDWPRIAADIGSITELMEVIKKPVRYFIELSTMDDRDEAGTLAKICEQEGADEVIIGSTLRSFALHDIIIEAESIANHLSIPVGVFGKALSIHDLQRVEESRLNTALVPIQNMIELGGT